MTRTLKPAPLTGEAFEPFGDVIDADQATKIIPINQGYTTRFDDFANVDVSDQGGRTCVSIFRSKPMVPVVIRLMERHPLGSQAFIPLQRRPYLVVVAPPGEFKLEAVKAFHASGTQGVNYAKGTWHHFLLALDEESDFLVIDRSGNGANLTEVNLSEEDQFMVNHER